jgi:hypothetical protein
LARALCQGSTKITLGTEIAFRQVEQLPFLIGTIPLVLSCLFRGAGESRPWTWDEIKFLIYLKKWRRVLELHAQNHPGIMLLDHGPVFKLATLHAFGPSWLRSDAASAWWTEVLQEWAILLDRIIWLDAPDTLLKARIDARQQKHQVKGQTGSEVLQFLARYRTSYRYVLSNLATLGGPAVIRFDTSQTPIEQTAEEVLVACKRETHGF